MITATTALGGTTLTNAAGTSFTAGMWIAIESGTPRQEIAQVNGSNAGSVFTNGPLTYSHGTAATFWQILPYADVGEVVGYRGDLMTGCPLRGERCRIIGGACPGRPVTAAALVCVHDDDR